MLTRSVTQWTKASDKRLARLMSYINHTKQYWCVGEHTEDCKLWLCQDASFARDSHSEAVWKRFGTTGLHSGLALQNTVSIKAAMEFDFPNNRYILDTLIGNMISLAAEGNLMLKKSCRKW